MTTADASRRRAHYAAFFGDAAVPDGFGVVVGNCQAESLRIVLDAPDRPTVRVPPVHELTADEARRLHELLPRAAFLVAQPVREGYHGLPLGTGRLRAAMSPGARVVTFPVARFTGLHPFQAVTRLPSIDEAPPVVEYHDIRTIAATAGLPVRTSLRPDSVHAIADDSLAELRRREEPLDVAISDLLRPVASDLMRTINHPGNALWLPLGRRVLEALGAPGEVTDPGRPLLNAVRAPLEDWVIDAWELPDAARPFWSIDGAEIDPEVVARAHGDWYRRHPLFVAAALERLKTTVAHWRI